MPLTFALTPAEMDFIHHFRHECDSLITDPARQWLRDHGICESVVITLLARKQEHNPRWLDRICDDP
jgi:hypothetical protein